MSKKKVISVFYIYQCKFINKNLHWIKLKSNTSLKFFFAENSAQKLHKYKRLINSKLKNYHINKYISYEIYVCGKIKSFSEIFHSDSYT